MSIINTYTKGSPASGDYLLGTKMPLPDTDDKAITQNFSVGDVAAFANTYSLGYTTYTAIVVQAGTAAPTVGIITNSLTGSPSLSWGYTSPGVYTVTRSSGTWPLAAANKLWIVMQGNDSTKSLHVARTADTILTITQLTAATAVAVNVIDYASLEIREYS
tara:strand:+ start:298 stop:780 length:483 start_codon:yes stop_codon:yes gene_type:complete